MESLLPEKNNIEVAKNICLVPKENEPESLSAALALFYTLKELGKNVNLIAENVPSHLSFLIPSLDFISSPKNLIISIPRELTDVSQVYYEKNEEHLKIHLTLDRGNIKKDQVSFYFADPKPDLVITLGIDNLKEELMEHLDAFGFLLDVPLVAIGKNITKEALLVDAMLISQQSLQTQNKTVVKAPSLTEETVNLIKDVLGDHAIGTNTATCLLAGLVLRYENFKHKETSSDTLEVAASLMKKGANYQEIVSRLYKKSEEEMAFLSSVFQCMNLVRGKYVSVLPKSNFQNFTEANALRAVEGLGNMGIENDLLVLWQSHNSPPTIKGFFYSKDPQSIAKAEHLGEQGILKNNAVFFSVAGSDIDATKDSLLNRIS